MSDDAVEIERVGVPAEAGVTREGKPIELIVVVDGSPDDAKLPNYYVDQLGTIRQYVADTRAGAVLGRAIYERRRRNIDRIALSVQLERLSGADYSDLQVAALHSLLAYLQQCHNLPEAALATILLDEEERPRIFPYLPPAPPLDLGMGVLGAAPDEPPQRLWLWLYGQAWKQRGGEPKLNTAFAYYAAKFGLGAPMAPNQPPPASFGGKSYNYQTFARDTIFNEGNDWTGIQTMRKMLEGTGGPENVTLALAQAGFDASIKISEARLGAPFTHTKVFKPDWRFHIVAVNSGLGPAISDNYIINADQQYAFQVFAGDTLYTPMSEEVGFFQLSLTDPGHPAYQTLWAETYKYCKAPYDPNSPFQQRAVQDKLGTPLTGIFEEEFEGTRYKIQVFAFDTLYQGSDGQIRRMSELPLNAAVQGWNPTPPKVFPPPPPPDPPPAQAPSTIPAFTPKANDPSWPSPPSFNILTDVKGARERILGHIEWRRKPSKGDARSVEILNNWVAENLVPVEVPQLSKFIGNNKISFHKVAAEQFRRFWVEVERLGYLPLVLNWAGAWNARVMTSDYSKLSNHAYGTAFDINVKWNGWQVRPALAGQQGSVRELVPIANALGFFWGGHWSAKYYDGMHFEWAVAR